MLKNDAIDTTADSWPCARQGAQSRCGAMVTVFAVSLGAAIVTRWYGLFPSVIVDWDESLYAVIADGWLNGLLPYRDIWDHHPPGLPALFAAILDVFPDSIVAIRVSACVAVAATATALFFMARATIGGAAAPPIAAALYLAWTARLWGLVANTEVYINALMAPAMYILVRQLIAPTRRQLASLCLGALLVGIALQIKHVALTETALFLGLALWCRSKAAPKDLLRSAAALAASFLAPSLLVLAYFQWHGLAGEYLASVVTANLTYIGDRANLAHVVATLPRTLFLPIALVPIAALVMKLRSDRANRILLAWGLAACVDVVLPGQYWLHYFLLAMPAAALLAAYLAAVALARRTTAMRVAVAAAVFVAAYPIGIYKDAAIARAFGEDDVPQAIADAIRDEGAPGAYIFVLNYQPIIYLLADAKLPNRHVFPGDWTERFSGTSGVDPVQEVDKIFAKKPAFVVFIDKDWNDIGAEAFAAFKAHLDGYEKDLEFIDRQMLPEPVPIEVYRRKA